MLTLGMKRASEVSVTALPVTARSGQQLGMDEYNTEAAGCGAVSSRESELCTDMCREHRQDGKPSV